MNIRDLGDPAFMPSDKPPINKLDIAKQKQLERMAEAYAIQDACNPIPVARMFAECVSAANADPRNTLGSAAWRVDPACLIMFDKLNDMLNRGKPLTESETMEAMHACRNASITVSEANRKET